MNPWWIQQTVVVTGASSGIGTELARGLARDAGCLVLVARRRDRLTALASELTAANPRLHVEVAPADLSDEEALAGLPDRIRRAAGPVDVLVNNAGLGDAQPLARADWERLRRLVDVNVLAPLRLTHDLVGPMVDRGRGGVLTIGSGAGHTAIKNSATYAATKHFIDGLMESLRLELAGTGVVATQVCPGPVPTEFDVSAGVDAEEGMGGLPRFFSVSAARCAADALTGFARRQAIVYPGQPYRALMGVLPLIPRPLLRRTAR